MKTQIQNLYRTVLFLVFIISILACNEGNEKNKKNEQEAIPVLVSIAKEQQFINELNFSGTVFANREANLGSSMPGKVEKFHYDEGQFVDKGDTLASLSSEMLTQARIEYRTLKKDFNRIKRLYKKKSVSEMKYDHIKAEMEAAKVKTQMLEKNTSVVAPFSGMIVDFMLEEGENYFFTLSMKPEYSNTSGILRLMQLNPVKIEIEVNEKMINSIREGQKVTVIPDAYPDKRYTGIVSYIKPMLSTMTHATKVEIRVPNPDLKLKPGMYVRCIISTGKQSGVFIPMDAVMRQAGTPDEYVYMVKNDSIAQKQVIKKLETRGGKVIVDSIKHGDTVIVKGKNDLKNGSIINIQDN